MTKKIAKLLHNAFSFMLICIGLLAISATTQLIVGGGTFTTPDRTVQMELSTAVKISLAIMIQPIIFRLKRKIKEPNLKVLSILGVIVVAFFIGLISMAFIDSNGLFDFKIIDLRLSNLWIIFSICLVINILFKTLFNKMID